MTTINKEHFEAWLMSQKPTDTFYYRDICNCLLSRFLHQCTPFINACVGDTVWVHTLRGSNLPLPAWWLEFVKGGWIDYCGSTTFAAAQSRWTSLHPIDSQTIPITFPSPVAAVDVEVGL